MKYLAVVGSRSINESRYPEFEQDIANALLFLKCDAIVSGGARGVDRMAEIHARKHHIPVKVIPANWNRYGKQAGFIRNSEIIRNCHAVLAILDGKSRGTLDSLNKAKSEGKESLIIRTNDGQNLV